jgi:hypothetical protein
MKKRYKGEIDGFWLFIILVFIVVPLAREVIQKLPGGPNDETSVEVVVTATKEIADNESFAPVAPKGSLDIIYRICLRKPLPLWWGMNQTLNLNEVEMR